MTAEEFQAARRQLVQAAAILTAHASRGHTLEARNLIYRTDEFLEALDAFYAAGSVQDRDDE
jgi:hypothetical protein